MLDLKQALIRVSDLTFQDHSPVYVCGNQLDHAGRVNESVLVAKDLELPLLCLFLFGVIAENSILAALC